jgi:CheY-like chemotaxis protein
MANVLIVDDTDLAHLLMQVMLRRMDHQAISAFNGKEALEILSQTSIDLILSDINMPYMDGLTLLDRIRADERYAHVPVVIITASGLEANQIRAMEKGATAFLNQPFSSQELAEVILACLEHV